MYLTAKDLAERLDAAPAHRITAFHEPESATVLDFGVDGPRDFGAERASGVNIYEAVVDHIGKVRKAGKKAILASYSAGSRDRLAGLLADHELTNTVKVDSWQEALGVGSKSVALLVLPLDHGFAGPEVALLTEQDMLGDRLVRRTKRKKSADAFLAELAMLTPGDLVVHADHGIGRYEGLTSIPVGQAPHDCVALTYAGGDKLFVPVENLEVLTRYGSDADGASLDKLGGEAWQRRKSRMKERIREIAGELIATAAERALRPADTIERDSGYAAFVDRFPYEETEDQDRAIEDVMGDLGKGTPMDRLVVGDVGFGKTEVALRAAFAAAMSGLQVAVVCPTTLLARQHFNNFKVRLKGFPLNVGRLSRLVPAGEAKATKEGLTDGTIDVVVGTHAILAKGIDFKRLGLVIVDEEQRFGVTHKERLKALKSDVHVLTLTATPIPRTLQMAMSGLRELSVIQTPPVDRLAVRTYVMPWDPVVLREALLREHYRGGQSFFVTPRIKDLPDIEKFLRESVPEVRYVVAHGQMAPTEVEERMSAFYDKKFEVLVSTTIVESGLDIPSANTMIIHRADRFGLAQLYQLRGRVGRAKTRAYAYLTTPADRILTETAEKRLKVLSDLDSLGGGFQLASHDLDQRGAGQFAWRRTIGAYQGGWLRTLPVDAGRSDHGRQGRRPAAPSQGLLAADHRRRTDPYSRGLRSGPRPADGPLPTGSTTSRTRNALEGFAAELIDRFGALPATDRKSRAAYRDQAQREEGVCFEDRRWSEGRAGVVLQRCATQHRGIARLGCEARRGGAVAARFEARRHTQLG